MSMKDLHDFIAHLESGDELVRIRVETDPLLEIAAITDRVCKRAYGGRALLFERPTGARHPVATNLFGSVRRTTRALGIDRLEQIDDRLSSLLGQIPAPLFEQLDRQIALLPEFARFTPPLGQATGLQAMQSDLSCFPFLQTWPGDGSAEDHPRYITLPLVFSAAPDGSSPNCGLYRCQVRGKVELAIRWQPGSGAARHLEAFRRAHERMPVAIALGGPPSALFSAMMPLPGDLDEMTFAGFLAGEPIPMSPCRTVPLRVPATAEVVIEGHVEPDETVMEGPFGNHTGCYSPAGAAPLMRVTAISHRADAVIPATVAGPPPMEDCWMALAWERVVAAFLRRLLPGLVDIRFPPEWVFHQSGVVSLADPSPGAVREIAQRLWALPWFAAARLLIFVHAGEAPVDFSAAAWRAINLADPGLHLFRDPAGLRLALDATGSTLALRRILPESAVTERIARRWNDYGV